MSRADGPGAGSTEPARRRPGRMAAAVTIGVAALAAAAPAASAAEKSICVNTVSNSCTETQPAVGSLGDQLQAAIDVAEAHPGTDSILVGNGEYSRTYGFRYQSGSGTLLVQGRSSAGVTLRNDDASYAGTTFTGTPNSGVVVVRNLTVLAPPGQQAVGISLGTANSRVVEARVAGPAGGGGAPTAIQGSGISVEDVTIDGVSEGVVAQGPQFNLERTSVEARGSAVTSYAPTATLRRLRATTTGGNASAFVSFGGNATVENSVLDASNADPDANNQAVGAICDAVGPVTSPIVTLRFVTLRSAAAFGAYSSCTVPGRSATLSIADSVLAPGTHLRTSSSGGGAATAAIRDSRWDGSGVGAISPGPGLRTDGPLFVSATDLRLQPSSPLIDAGTVTGPLLAEPYLGDLLGGPRLLDGNGDGVAVPDLGAYEAATYVPPVGGGGDPGGGGDGGSGGVPGSGDPGGGTPGGGGSPGGGSGPTPKPTAVTVRRTSVSVPGGTLSLAAPRGCVKPKGSYTVRMSFVASKRGSRRSNVVVKVTRADFYVDGKRKAQDRKAPFSARLKVTSKKGRSIKVRGVARLKVKRTSKPRTRSIDTTFRVCR